MLPEKLREGDGIRVIAPAISLGIISKSQREIVNKRFDELGLKLSFSKNAEEKDEFNSSSIDSRVNDLHEAFLDNTVRAIITVIGGFNSNQLLKYNKKESKNFLWLLGYNCFTKRNTDKNRISVLLWSALFYLWNETGF